MSPRALREYRTNRILTAGPVRLVTMLYEGALTWVARARQALIEERRDLWDQALSKVIGIMAALHGALDTSAGEEVAENLDLLYRYILGRLTHANRHRDSETLAEVHQLLTTLLEAWRQAESEQQRLPRSA